MRAIYSIIFFTIFLSSCTEDRYFEKNQDFEDRVWNMDESAKFNFEIDSVELPYRIKLNIRNTMEYPYRNLYIQYNLEYQNEKLTEKLHEIQLFEGKTGKPYGEPQSEIYSHQLLIQDSVYFPNKGSYTVILNQYMREKELKGMVSVGLRIEQMK